MSMFRRYFGWALSAMLFAVGSINAQDAWPTIFHDAQRTSASRDGYITLPLTAAWSYTPTPNTGWEFKQDSYITNLIATPQAVYQHYYVDPVGLVKPKGAIDKITLNGQRVWTNQSLGLNSDGGHHLALGSGMVYFHEDYLTMLRENDGTRYSTSFGIDVWGNIIADQGIFYTANCDFRDGAGIWVGAFTAPMQPIWKQNYYGDQSDPSLADLIDLNRSSLVLDSGVLYFAPLYVQLKELPLPFLSGIYTFDAATGNRGWFVETYVTAPISMGQYLYSLEDSNFVWTGIGGWLTMSADATHLIARNKTNGQIVWSRKIAGFEAFSQMNGSALSHPWYQAPVVANGLVIVANAYEVVAVSESSGEFVWRHPLQGVFPLTQLSIRWWRTDWSNYTVMAAALASNTLVVTANDGIHILSLENGSDLGVFYPAQGRYINPVIVANRLYVTNISNDASWIPHKIVAIESEGYIPPPTPVTYNCVNYTCVDPGNGTGYYATLTECQTACQPPPPKETTPPTLVILYPPNGATFKRGTTINVQTVSTDNVGVDRVVLSVGDVTQTKTSEPYNFSWRLPMAPNKSHTLTVTSYDAANNSVSKSVTIRSSK